VIVPRRSSITLVALLVSALVALPAGGLAKGGGTGDVLKSGSCSKSSSVKIKLSPENGRIEAELEVDQNRKGVRWSWSLKRGGARLAAGTAFTAGPSGSFEVRRVVSNAAGRDTIVGTASRGGETCTVTASI
jgi:hypothetical protein